MTKQSTQDINRIFNAIAQGVSGDSRRGLQNLLPIFERGPVHMLATLAALVEVATIDTRERQPEGTFFGLIAMRTDGAPGSIDDAPIGIRFAAQFTAACSNRDLDTARELFFAFLNQDIERQGNDLMVGIRTVYEMAVTSARTRIGPNRTA